MKTRIMYIELKSTTDGHTDRGPAWIGRVTFNRTGKTLSWRGKRFQRGCLEGCGNYHDVETGEGYWISGAKKDGNDRFGWATGAKVEIDEDVREEYWTAIRCQPERAAEKFT
ncbi:MAG TPA: 1-deoxy-D-xylulose-5-phosphate synthase [Myxococcota bacterium]|nr:1-deoxy-D-xylulose-5-phosphate synthase [Myxococcota bacterium]HRY93272.1 1-deoxy-D-xylulose-5-phosphate synthase [Myxococcota bacterium]HSA19945.1 1-deoxy-D-xylulose-5-phosphate synthase [Myxococcota bacterium]